MKKIRVMTIFGTRPEAFRLASLIKEFREYGEIESIVCTMAQSRDLLEQSLNDYDIHPDFELGVGKQGQTHADFVGQAIEGFDRAIRKAQPDLVLVHGYTMIAHAGSLAAVYNKARLACVEEEVKLLGQYSSDFEEMNRKLIATMADLHFAPTYASKKYLVAGGTREQGIYVTGDLAIDAMNQAIEESHMFQYDELNKIDYGSRKVIMVAARRRENWGEPIENICMALKRIALSNQDVEIVFPMHLNPVAKETSCNILSGLSNVHLVPAMGIADSYNLMSRCCMVMSDSGGFSEEAINLGKPLLVLCRTMEKPEMVASGAVRFIGSDEEKIIEEGIRLLHGRDGGSRMASMANGDGNATKRIAEAILFEFGLLDKMPEDYRSRRT